MMRIAATISIGFLLTGFSGCVLLDESSPGRVTVTQRPFGTLPDGTPIRLFVLSNPDGMTAKISEFGAILTELHVPDGEGVETNVVLGFDNLGAYVAGHPAYGSTIGRFANRIRGARFMLDGAEVRVTANAGENHIHGGHTGFHKVAWKGVAGRADANAASARFTYLSRDGEEGFPGNLSVTVTYTLTTGNELRITFEAATDKPTVVNLTNHSYFNLAGHGNVLDHQLWLAADQYTVSDKDLIPTGEIASVRGTPLDFNHPTAIGKRIEQLQPRPGGYDHNYVLRNYKSGLDQPTLAARVREPASGRVMEVRTTEPGVQLYTGNHLKPRHAGFCLETQHYPDSPNHESFPSTVLRPGERFLSETVFAFSNDE